MFKPDLLISNNQINKMINHTDKSSESQNQVNLKQNETLTEQAADTLDFENKRPEAIAQRKLQKMSNNNPRIRQLKVIQEMANNYASHLNPFLNKKNKAPSTENINSAIQRKDVVQRVRDRWLLEHPAMRTLVQGIDGNAPPGQILSDLVDRFRGMGENFTYTMAPNGLDNFLGGNLSGDCRTLALGFKAIAENYFEIDDVTVGAATYMGIHKSDAPNTPYGGRNRNCNNGTCWLFKSHTWASWGGSNYDLLFCEINPNFNTVPGAEHDSKMYPEESYVALTNNEVAYQTADMSWHLMPLSNAQKFGYLMKNGTSAVLRATRNFLVDGFRFLTTPFRYIARSIRDRISPQEDVGFGSLLRELRPDDDHEE